MKILFVCKANVGRSQMAEAFYEKYYDNKNLKSAGYAPGDWVGRTLDSTRYVKVCMDEEGIDLRKKVSKAIEEKMVNWADKIIVFDSKKADWPDYLRNSDKVEIWETEDPGGKDLEIHRIVRDQIKERIRGLIGKLKD